jgi:hypothetical protein
MRVIDWCRLHIPEAFPEQVEIARLRALISDVAHSGVEFDGARNYVVVQIDRHTWADIQDEVKR